MEPILVDFGKFNCARIGHQHVLLFVVKSQEFVQVYFSLFLALIFRVELEFICRIEHRLFGVLVYIGAQLNDE